MSTDTDILVNLSATIKTLTRLVKQVLATPMLTYPEICRTHHQGLYLIFRKGVVLYVGKTGRSGKVRMRELASDFRSHTFNKKMLSERFKRKGVAFSKLSSKAKTQMIKDAILTDVEFKSHQSSVNDFIRIKLKFRFLPIDDEKILSRLEHFAIATLDPPYNE